MSLASQVTALASALRDKINLMVPRLLPSGGTTGQTLVKSSASNYAVGWVTTSSAVVDPLDLAQAAPTNPAAGVTRVFRQPIANRQFPAFIDLNGQSSALQPLMARSNVGYWMPPGNNNIVPGILGYTTFSIIGTATARTIATTNLFTRMRRLGYVSATTAASLAAARVASAQITIGVTLGTVKAGGFFKVCRFGCSDAATVAGARQFVGIGTTASPTNIEPSTLINCVGVGHGAADTNLKLYSGGATAQAPIDLGVNFPANTLSVDVYELALYCAVGSSVIEWQVTRLNTGDTISGTLNGAVGTAIPASTTLMSYMTAWRSNNATALAVGLDIFSDYIETNG